MVLLVNKAYCSMWEFFLKNYISKYKPSTIIRSDVIFDNVIAKTLQKPLLSKKWLIILSTSTPLSLKEITTLNTDVRDVIICTDNTNVFKKIRVVLAGGMMEVKVFDTYKVKEDLFHLYLASALERKITKVLSSHIFKRLDRNYRELTEYINSLKLLPIIDKRAVNKIIPASINYFPKDLIMDYLTDNVRSKSYLFVYRFPFSFIKSSIKSEFEVILKVFSDFMDKKFSLNSRHEYAKNEKLNIYYLDSIVHLIQSYSMDYIIYKFYLLESNLNNKLNLIGFLGGANCEWD